MTGHTRPLATSNGRYSVQIDRSFDRWPKVIISSDGQRSMATIYSYFKPKETVVPPPNGSLSKVVSSSSIQLASQTVSKVIVDGKPKLSSWIEMIAWILCSYCFCRSNQNWKNTFVSKRSRLCTVRHWCEWSMFSGVSSAEAVDMNRSKGEVRTKLDDLQILL